MAAAEKLQWHTLGGIMDEQNTCRILFVIALALTLVFSASRAPAETPSAMAPNHGPIDGLLGRREIVAKDRSRRIPVQVNVDWIFTPEAAPIIDGGTQTYISTHDFFVRKQNPQGYEWLAKDPGRKYRIEKLLSTVKASLESERFINFYERLDKKVGWPQGGLKGLGPVYVTLSFYEGQSDKDAPYCNRDQVPLSSAWASRPILKISVNFNGGSAVGGCIVPDANATVTVDDIIHAIIDHNEAIIGKINP